MLINKISYINFKENELSREMVSKDAILMLRDPNASVKFQQNREMAQNADASATNPLTALGYKLYRTFSMLREEPEPAEKNTEEKHLNTIA